MITSPNFRKKIITKSYYNYHKFLNKISAKKEARTKASMKPSGIKEGIVKKILLNSPLLVILLEINFMDYQDFHQARKIDTLVFLLNL
jgi:hypothetical protein